ncbi:Palmitoyltransferase PFA5 [Wickerhamomyces ciferrii]|uniref:Palmitoyltransferase n=1 Tax=Wickerhamomyces ciferrii (strain ATCC 14091 / BCRC 22168 / CBS 111 / JCM 3599 / NBRC 0793 / NRRL Y-1031 F-60-10) TaxID=1206466 RepID=K0KMR7_WICCF|nr:Palmitoyltransferase PFA5 [Wickerhamomyces ciferrii]CCH42413.1 Palmitoyltransferase PFA5 [Wickerhamomyces ciferrii]
MTDWRHAKRSQLKIIIPVLITCGMIYLSWVYSYFICWNEIYKHHSKSTGIGLIIGNILFILLIYGIWFQILIIGPGKQPKVPLFRILQNVDETGYNCIEPPEYFMCSKDGFPIWCSECQSIKIDRSHHSSDLGYCIPKMDHFCTFLGAVIGKENYHLFIQLCWWWLCYFIFIGISMACFTKQYKDRKGSVNANIIIVYVAVIGWILMIFALFSSHIYYIYGNKTSIDDMRRKRNRRTNTLYDEYVSLKHNDKRYILRINPDNDNI